MIVIEHPDCIEVRDIGHFSPVHTFECGQCFRFAPHPDGGYAGIAFGRFLRLWCEGDSLFLQTTRREFDEIWLRYLDLERDYGAIDRLLCGDELLQTAVSFGRGLRVLAQDPWEMLCTFILSQRCSIPRIRSMVNTLCSLFGDGIETPDGLRYGFPSPEALARCSEADLAPIKAGYRASFLCSAAQTVAGGFDFQALRDLPTDQARTLLTGFRGVGRKVADCTLLFGLQKLDAFPIDTWMKKAAALWPQGFPSHLFGETAGIAQQYIFYYVRSQKKPSKKRKDLAP